MKKGIIVLTVVLTMGLGLSAVSAFAWNCGGPGGGYGMRGWGGNPGSSVSDADYKKFMDETAELRKSMAVDRAVLQALMAGSEPDPVKVAELKGRMWDNREKLAAVAQSLNINAGPGCDGPNANCGYGGRGKGPRGNCDGAGYGGRGNCGGPGSGPRGPGKIQQ